MKRALMGFMVLVALMLGTVSAQANESAIDELLKSLAAESTDPWAQAIYEAGAIDIHGEEGTWSFLMRSFNPLLAELGKYDDDPTAWRDQMLDNISAYDLEVTVTEDELAADSAPSLKSAVTKAASSARSAFDDKRVRVAIADYLFPSPAGSGSAPIAMPDPLSDEYIATAGSLLVKGEEKEYAPLFLAQVKQSLAVKGGPHALTLNCQGAKPEKLLDLARQSVYTRLSREEGANQLGEQALADAFGEALWTQALSISKSKVKDALDDYTFTLDIDDLKDAYAGVDYVDYINEYDHARYLSILVSDVGELPDYPALDFPKSGRIEGGQKGTKVIFKAPSDGRGRYVQVRNEESDELQATLFIRPGSSATVYVPRGMNYFLVASGEIWFGPEHLFGDAGGYSRTESIEIMSSKYYHTITLSISEGGNMSSYSADPSDFQ